MARPLALQDTGPGGNIVVGFAFPFAVNGGFALTLNLAADTILDLPTGGTVVTSASVYPGPFANDTAAAAGGVRVGGLYRQPAGAVAWRQA